MKIRIKSPELRRIWYIDVEDAPPSTPEEIRVRVARELKRQYQRLVSLQMELVDGDEVLGTASKRGF